MNVKLVRLSFGAPVHFGKGRLSDSDYSCGAATLFSAFSIEALKMGVADELLEAANSGEFQISDAFPYVEDQLYVPKPLVRIRVRSSKPDSVQELQARKASKRLRFIPLDCLEKYLAGEFDSVSELRAFRLGESFLRTKVNLTREYKNEPDPYFVGSFLFSPGAGLYFFLRGSYDPAPILEQLEYSGIGGKRSSGYGRFTYEIRECDPFLARRITDSTDSRAERFMLLSSSVPAAEELDYLLLEGARYRLGRKGGFVQSSTYSTTPQKKREMYAFLPGSMFLRTFKGAVFDLNATPGAHSVHRYARALWMEV